MLREEEARHALKSLRLSIGDQIVAVDGQGQLYQAEIVQVAKVQLYARILQTQSEVGELSHRLGVGIALLKNPNRFETFLEKAVELGVTEIFPLQTHRTERVHFNPDRFERILLAALKQSGRTRLPKLHTPIPFKQALEMPFEHKFIPHEKARLPIQNTSINGDCLALIGPEGGFTDEEVMDAQHCGFQAVSLGARRLRAETAAIVTTGWLSFYLSSD